MKILAIESSCDETAAAVVENGRRVLSSVVATQVEEHKLYGGVVPEIASNYITNPELEPPFLCLVVSGGHTHIIEVTDYTKLRILGKTRDDAAGEAFDKAARAMGMPYPGGIAMDKLAETGNDKAFKLPRPTVDGAPLDFSFTPQTRPAIKSSSSRVASPQTRSCAAASRKNASVPAARSICPTSLSPATTPPWSAHRPTTNISPAIPPA